MESNNTVSNELTTPKKKLSKKDINQLAWWSLMLQHNFNYERYQGTGFGAALAPTLAKIYGDDKEGLAEALKEHTKFFNSSPPFVPFIMGVVCSMEEDRAPRDAINAVKNSLFPPIAGIGDAVVWYTALPLAAGVGGSIAANGSFFGVVVFLLILGAVNCLHWPSAHLGYNLGTKAIDLLGEKINTVATAASMVGCTVLGSLIASYVNFAFTIQIPLTDTFSLDVQSQFFDSIFPNFVPAALTAAIYFLYKKKHVKPFVLIIIILVFCIACSYLGLA